MLYHNASGSAIGPTAAVRIFVKSMSPRLFDLSAIGLSGLCLVHCLALPLVAAVLPMFGPWARAEWVHGVFVAIAAPLSAGALWLNSRGERRPAGLYVAALAGLALLALGAVGWPSPALETPITVTGSLSLVGAHLWNWRRRHRGHAHAVPGCDPDDPPIPSVEVV
jgi:hypothetical protein